MARRKSTGRRVLTIGLVGVGSVLLLVIAALVVVTLPPGERVVRGIIEDQLSSALYQPVEVGEFETNLLSRIRLEDVRIPAREPDSGGVFINEIEVHYRLWPLLRQKLAIESARLDSAEIVVVHDSAQGYNMPLLDSLALASDSADADTAGGFSVELGPIEVRRLDAGYVDRTMDFNARLPGVSLQTDTTGSEAMTFSVRSEPGMIEYGGYWSEEIRLTGAGRWTDSAVMIDTLSFTLEQLQLAVAGSIPIDEQGQYAATATLSGDPSGLVASIGGNFDLPDLAAEGPVEARAEVTGNQTSPQALIRIQMPAIRTKQATVRDGFLRARVTADTLMLDSLYAQTLGGAISAAGGLAIDSILNGRVEILVKSVDVQEVIRAVSDSASAHRGEMSGRATIEMNGNDWTRWDVTTDLRATNLSYNSAPLRDLDVNISLRESRAKAEIWQEELTVTADVNIADSALDGTLSVDVRDLEPLAAWLNLEQAQGSLQAEAALGGSFTNPSVAATITGAGIEVNGIPADTLDATVRWADSSLFVNRLIVQGGAASQSVEQPLLGVDSLLGAIQYRAEVSGRLDSLSGDVQVDMHHMRYGSMSVDSVIAQIDLSGEQAVVDSLIAAAEGLVLLGEGAYNLATRVGQVSADIREGVATLGSNGDGGNGRLETKGLIAQIESEFRGVDTTGLVAGSAEGTIYDLSALEAFTDDSLALGGTARFSVSAGGLTDAMLSWQGDLILAVDSTRYQDFALDSIRIAAALNDGLVVVENLAAYVADQSALASGRVLLAADTAGNLTVAAQSRLEGSVRLNGFDVSRLQPFLPEGTSLAGTADADIEWSGTASDPMVRGSLGLRSGRYAWITAEEEQVVEDIVVVGSVRDSTLVLDTVGARIAGRPLSIAGSLTLVEGERIRTDLAVTVGEFPAVIAEGTLSRERLDFTARVDSLDLEVLQPFVPNVERLEGVLTGQIEITGTAKAPAVDGRIAARSVTLKPTIIDEPFTGGYFAASFTGDSAVIDSLSAQMKDGSVTGSGALSFDTSGVTDIDLRVSGRNLDFTAMDNTEVVIDSIGFTYQHPGDYFLLQGVVDLGESRYTENFQPTAILPWTQEVQAVETELPVFLARTRLDIRLTGSDSLWIDNNLANLRANAELQFQGFMAQPQVSGRLSTEDGYVLYLDRKFDVTEGVAFFTDPSQINPELSLRAETEVTSYRQTEPTTYDITLAITGRLQDPTVELTSEPPLTQPDVVAVLTLGATRGELAGQTGDILEERAGAIASQQISGFASEQVGDLLGLDRVSVSGNIFDVNDTTGPELIASERVSEDVTLEYRTTVGHLNDQRISVYWQLHRRWLIEGTTNRSGRSSLNLTYILRMR